MGLVHCQIYFHSFEIFIIQIVEMAFCKPEFIIIKSNIFRMLKKANAFAMILKLAWEIESRTSVSKWPA
jgi:polyphosphate kinase